MMATRLGETPFMGLLPCASFAMRVKVRTLFGIKVTILDSCSTRNPVLNMSSGFMFRGSAVRYVFNDNQYSETGSF